MTKKKIIFIGFLAGVILVSLIFVKNGDNKERDYSNTDIVRPIKNIFRRIPSDYQDINEILQTNTVRKKNIASGLQGSFNWYASFSTGQEEWEWVWLMKETVDSIYEFNRELSKKYDKYGKISRGEVLVELDDSLRDKFEKIHHMYKGWLKALDGMEGIIIEDGEVITDIENLEDNYNTVKAFNDDFDNFGIRLEEETRKTLEYYGVDSMEELLLGNEN
ncbi:hypothetical protein RBH29_16210 [Herbivorax sp. ANBcel31]|uniref:hypothetical protein n=1 Tax=Herbivorax sp. ANBcel31 TaxID=3069754 RepID=UPI0027B1A7A5|nr:hypothetical protein [Herbivorax sp. ANBcel31]MDQ2087974.1 hypothetical protein [Herbivorax sp. ANBcel31]